MNSAPPVSVLSLLHGGCAIYPDSQTGWFMAFIICCGTNDHTHKGDCFQRTLAQGGVWWFDLNGRDAVTVAYLSKMAEILTVSHSEASFEKHLLFNATFTPKGKLRLNTFILFLRLKTHSAILLYNQAHNLCSLLYLHWFMGIIFSERCTWTGPHSCQGHTETHRTDKKLVSDEEVNPCSDGNVSEYAVWVWIVPEQWWSLCSHRSLLQSPSMGIWAWHLPGRPLPLLA